MKRFTLILSKLDDDDMLQLQKKSLNFNSISFEFDFSQLRMFIIS